MVVVVVVGGHGGSAGILAFTMAIAAANKGLGLELEPGHIDVVDHAQGPETMAAGTFNEVLRS